MLCMYFNSSNKIYSSFVTRNSTPTATWQQLIIIKTNTVYTIYILLGQLNLSYNLALVHLIPFWLGWAKIVCMVQVALPKQPINQFQLVH